MNQKDILWRITSLYYPSVFKIFQLEGGGYFISLGITTSLESLDKLRRIIAQSSFGYEAYLAELRTEVRNGIHYNFLNGTDNIVKYSSDLNGSRVLSSKEEAYEYVDSLSDFNLSSRIIDLIRRIKIQYEDNWESYKILLKDSPDIPVIFYNEVNYKKDEERGLEYRIGIFVPSI